MAKDAPVEISLSPGYPRILTICDY